MQHSDSTECGHVHFPEEVLTAQHEDILIQNTGSDHVDVKLGFLQVNHIYELKFMFRDSLGEDLISDPTQNLFVKLLEYQPTEDGEGHKVTLEFSAHREKLLTETLVLQSKENPEKKLNLTLHARVLGKGKGTPALKQGVRLLRIDFDEESDMSDWQGFTE